MSQTLHVFKSTMPSVNFILGNGKPCIFQNGVFRTAVDSEIAALQAEVKAGHPHIYVDPAEETIDSELVDPMNALRAKIIAEYLAAEKAAVDPANQMGDYKQEPVRPQSSSDVATAVANGDGAARLINLAANLANKAK